MVKTLSRWKPAYAGRPFVNRRLLLGSPGDTEEELALAVLSALSIAGVHSSLNPSLFTLMAFSGKPEAKRRAMTGLWIGLGASTLASGAIYLVFKKMLPAIIAEATAVGLFMSGVWAINQAPSMEPGIQEQETLGP